MKLLLVGSSSFAAQGLTELLRNSGHEVWSFNRRPERALGERGLGGSIANITDYASQLQECDVAVNYLLLKDASIEENLRFLQVLNQLLVAIKCRRFIHISSVSVLAPSTKRVSEKDDPPSDFRQKGPYARLKIATERWVTQHVTHCEIVLVRPGFVVAPGLPDPIIGIGKLLPTQKILCLGHRKSIIPIVSRQILNEGLLRLCTIPLPARRTTAMFTGPDSPTREDYLNYCCAQFGLGRGTLFLRPEVWWLSLGAASLPLTIMKGRWNNLAAKFSHNLKVRRYDSGATEKLLNLDLRVGWKRLLGEALEFQSPNFRLPAPFTTGSGGVHGNVDSGICYLGMGRIALERHIPALRKFKYSALLEWYDPFVGPGPAEKFLKLQRRADPIEFRGSRAVLTTPVGPRMGLLSQIPVSITELLFEKPFAISAFQFSELEAAMGQRTAYVIHNYRFKPNVQWALGYLAHRNPGQIQETRLHFDSPAVDSEKAHWMREERQARTLLIDYAIHFLDLAWLFAEGRAEVRALDVQRNLKGQTMSVRATVKFANHLSQLFLRQGARQRRCQIELVFSNYTVVLRFFPDTVAIHHGEHTFADDFRLGIRGLAGVGRKVAEKLGMCDVEPSHQYVLGSFLGRYPRENITALSLASLKPFYSRLFALAEPAYADPAPSSQPGFPLTMPFPERRVEAPTPPSGHVTVAV